jgi:hypothetical protein
MTNPNIDPGVCNRRAIELEARTTEPEAKIELENKVDLITIEHDDGTSWIGENNVGILLLVV